MVMLMSEQGTEEWLQDRLGYCTASNFAAVLSGGTGVTRKKYLRRIVVERLTQKPLDNYTNPHMERGNEQEPYARMNYEAATGNIVNEVGFIKHESIMVGASPDGLIEKDGGLEIKSVLPTVQIETIEKGKFPTAHRAQVQGCLWITGRKWWDFVSYSPDLPENLSLYIYRIERDEEYIEKLASGVEVFLNEVDMLFLNLKNKEI